MILNPNVSVDTTRTSFDRFAAEPGFTLWRDNEEGNLDENGNPLSFSPTINSPKAMTEELAPHIWAKTIEEATSPDAEMEETEEKAKAYDILMGVSE